MNPIQRIHQQLSLVAKLFEAKEGKIFSSAASALEEIKKVFSRGNVCKDKEVFSVAIELKTTDLK